jgi:hypothetical protein
MKFCPKATGSMSAVGGRNSCIESAAAAPASSSSSAAAPRRDADLGGFMMCGLLVVRWLSTVSEI